MKNSFRLFSVGSFVIALIIVSILCPHQGACQATNEKLHSVLAQTLEELSPDSAVPVALWLKSPELSDLTLSGPLTTEQRDAFFDEYRARHHAVAQPVITHLQNLGYSAKGSDVAPTVFVDLPETIIRLLAQRQDVLYVYLQPSSRQSFVDSVASTRNESLQPVQDVTSEVETIRAPTVWARGYEGQDAPLVAIVEGDKVDFDNPYLRDGGESSIVAPEGNHATAVAGIVASNPEEAESQGIAPDWFYKGVAWRLGSGVYSAPYTSHGSSAGDLDESVTQALDAGVLVLNNSWGSWEEVCQQEPILNWDSVYFDYISRHLRVTVVTAVGNWEGRHDTFKSWAIPNPAWAYNVITVGGIDDQNDADWDNDQMWYHEDSHWCYQDETYCGDAGDDQGNCWGSVYSAGSFNRDKPEICAVATYVDTTLRPVSPGDPWVGRYARRGGTSFAAPAVAGGVVLLMERNGTLETEPETIKAILLASARHDVYEGTNHDGLGGVDLSLADQVVRDGQFAVFTGLEAEFPQEKSLTATNGDVIRAVLTWASNPDGSYVTNPLDTDFDLTVIGPDGNQVAIVQGSRDDNNFLWLEFFARQTGTYHLRATVRTWGSASTEPVGLAWAKLRHLGERVYLPVVVRNRQIERRAR